MSPLNMIPGEKPVNPRPVIRLWHEGGRRIFSGILIAVIAATARSSALVQTPPSPGGGFGHFSQGVPVYWPYHALLMSTGFILLVAGFVTARYYKAGNWYRHHVILEAAGGACIIAGLITGIYMVALSGLPHLRNIHEIAGVAAGILLIITITAGYLIKQVHVSKNVIRMSHRWLGRVLLVLVVINILLGLLFLSLILRR
jgi:heme A synthase